MSNPFKGEVIFNALGTTWTLCFTAAAWVALEQETGKPWSRIFDLLQGKDGEVSISMAAALLHAGLHEHHADITRARVHGILDDLGFFQALSKIAEGVTLSWKHHVQAGDMAVEKKTEAAPKGSSSAG